MERSYVLKTAAGPFVIRSVEKRTGRIFTLKVLVKIEYITVVTVQMLEEIVSNMTNSRLKMGVEPALVM
jgi:hypothetical protein